MTDPLMEDLRVRGDELIPNLVSVERLGREFATDVHTAASALGAPSSSDPYLFLAAELALTRMQRATALEEEAAAAVHDACQRLRVDAEGAGTAEVLRRVGERLDAAAPVNSAQSPPASEAAPACAVPGTLDLGPAQRAEFARLSGLLAADFQVRRSMMLTRLDVTIQSFLWSPQAQEREGEIVTSLKRQRSLLEDQPHEYTLLEVVRADRQALVNELSTTPEVGRKSIAKRAVSGATPPDRGGRADDMRPTRWDYAGGFTRRGAGGHGGESGRRGRGSGRGRGRGKRR